MFTEDTEYMTDPERSTLVTEDDYAMLLQDLLAFIAKTKEADPSAEIVEIITDFAFRRNIDVDIVGDAVSTDPRFVRLIREDIDMNLRQKEDW